MPVHVVGTNGKSSVTAMTIALLREHGRTAGGYVSPHSERWSERVRIDGEEIDRERFAQAVERVASAAARVERRLDPEDRITQFEAATAAAFVALAEAGVEFGVIEAGLGGRLDATNVIPSRVTALTSIGLDHTQWLGGTEVEIAGEKLAVLREGTTLVLGEVSAAVAALAAEVARERRARLVRAEQPPPAAAGRLGAPYLRRNLGVALAVVRELVGPLPDERVRDAIARLELPGRLEVLGDGAPVVLDAAHNPQGAAALAEALREAAKGRPVVACIAVLADKDARGIVGALAGVAAEAICTQLPAADIAGKGRPDARATEAEELAEHWREAGVPARALRSPRAAIEAALAAARERGGLAVICGSHYLLHYAHEALGAETA